MSRPAILAIRARRELAEALKRVADANPDAAERLYSAVQDAARRIGANPALGARRPRLASTRYRIWPIPRFRYILAYTDRTIPPRIVRMVHTSRDLPRVLADLLD